MADLFEITHEGNDLSEYTSTVTGGGDLSVAAGAALAGTNYGLSVLINDTSAIYGLKSFTSAKRVRLRFYLDPNAMTFSAGDENFIFELNPTTAFRVRFGHDGADYNLEIVTRDDSGLTFGGQFTITDVEHYVEVDCFAATNPGDNDGFMTVWVDGVQKDTIISLDNDTRAVDEMRIGATSSIDAGTSGTYYIDEIKANNDGSEIGEVPVAGGNPWYAYAQQ